MTLQIDWLTGELQYRFRTGIGDAPVVQLLASGVSHLSCPRRFPWGKSGSVNAVRVENLPSAVVLTVEMQSGDLIEATVETWHLE